MEDKNKASIIELNETDEIKQPGESTSTRNSLNSTSNSINTNLTVKTNLTKLKFKSISNNTTEVSVDLFTPIKNEIDNILSNLSASISTHDIKLIFSGKMLSMENTFDSYGKLLFFTYTY